MSETPFQAVQDILKKIKEIAPAKGLSPDELHALEVYNKLSRAEPLATALRRHGVDVAEPGAAAEAMRGIGLREEFWADWIALRISEAIIVSDRLRRELSAAGRAAKTKEAAAARGAKGNAGGDRKR